MGRAEYVKECFGVSLRWLNKLLQGDAEPKPNNIEEGVPEADTAQKEAGQHDTEQPSTSTEEPPKEDTEEGDAESDAEAEKRKEEQEARYEKGRHFANLFLDASCLVDPVEFSTEMQRVINGYAQQIVGIKGGRFDVTYRDLLKS